MKISAISDVHIKSVNDEAYKLFISFISHPEVKSSDYVLLLGDIFDLMVGPHEVYLKSYREIFDLLDKLQSLGKKIFFFEGNHDVHLEKLFKKIWKNDEIKVLQTPMICEIYGKKYYFSHGDEHEIDNITYQRYIKIIRSKPLKLMADHLMPYRVINFLGNRASGISRKKGARTFNPDVTREKFREGVAFNTEGECDIILGGHSHVQDFYHFPQSGGCYINNGYVLQTKQFITVENHIPRFVPLS